MEIKIYGILYPAIIKAVQALIFDPLPLPLHSIYLVDISFCQYGIINNKNSLKPPPWPFL
jgi:hypothetical protein